jgi:hypothetical protein
MDAILQGLLDTAGINAAVLYDVAGRLLAHRGRTVYDRALCERAGGPLARAIDSLQLQHDDWESASAQFADGLLLLRRLETTAAGPCVLALVTDTALNPAFATVAVRVCASKLKRALDGGAASSAVGSGGSSVGTLPGPGGSQVGHGGAGSRPVLAGAGVPLAADPPASAHLAACARELARHVGPMARIFVEESVRKVCPGVPFSMSASRPLADELASRIEDPAGRQAFLTALTRSGGT